MTVSAPGVQGARCTRYRYRYSGCRRCAEACPPRAIPFGEPQTAPINASNFVGIRKWSVDAEKCFKFGTNQGTECGICVRVCPYNKDPSTWARRMYYQSWRRLAAGPLRKCGWVEARGAPRGAEELRRRGSRR